MNARNNRSDIHDFASQSAQSSSTGSARSRVLSAEELDAFGAELDAVRQRVLAQVGEEDAKYIRKIQAWVRYTEVAGRGLLFGGILPPLWLAGTALLAASKILDNMELGHNVMHGQYDWMNDKEFMSTRFDWDNVCPADGWKRTHNYEHHTYTNVMGKDRDIGYGLLRLFPEQRWRPRHRTQIFQAAALAMLFQWGVAMHDVATDLVRRGQKTKAEAWRDLKPVLRKGARKLFKDYLLFPALAGPFFLPVLLGNLCANLVRNVWSFSIIFCGHFTEDAVTFPPSVLENESRGHWYMRQIQGSSNLTGGRIFHIFSGNLSHQIEHHLYPDIPARRYAEMAEDVQAICAKYGQHYNTGRFSKQFGSVIKRIWVYSSPKAGQEATGALASSAI